MSRYKHRRVRRKRYSRTGQQFWIYIHWIGEQCYVGFTARTPKIRLEEHLESAREGRKTNFYTALRKNNFRIDKSEQKSFTTEVDALVEEINLISQYGETAMNMTKGGEGNTINVKIKDGVLSIKPKKRRRFSNDTTN